MRLVRESSDLPRVAPAGRGAPQWAIGVAYPDLAIVCVATRRGGNYVDPMGTLRHELAHVALGVALGDKIPHWLQEGFAYQHSAEWSMDRSETLAAMAWLGGIVSIDDLDRSFPAEELPANKAYAQSYDFVGYLSRRGRWEDTYDDGDRWPFRRFLADVAHGKSLDAAAKKQFGKPIRGLFDEWRSNLDVALPARPDRPARARGVVRRRAPARVRVAQEAEAEPRAHREVGRRGAPAREEEERVRKAAMEEELRRADFRPPSCRLMTRRC